MVFFLSFLIVQKRYIKRWACFLGQTLRKKEPNKMLFFSKKQETTIRQGRVIKKKYYLFRLSLSVTTNILMRSQIAVNFLHSQREIKFPFGINTHLMKHSIICTSVPEHDNIITALNYLFYFPLCKCKGLKLQISEKISSISVDHYPS